MINKYYMALYGREETIIAVSTSKKDIIFYMETIRGLSKKEYILRGKELEPIDEDLYDFLFQREKLVPLEKGLLVPRRDIDYISKDYNRAKEELSQFRKNILKYSKIFQTIKKFNIASACLNFSIRLEDFFRKKKKEQDFDRYLLLSTEMFHMDIEEYIKFIKMDIEYQNNLKDYYRACGVDIL